MPVLLSNAGATGDAVQWTGGRGQFVLAGTLGGATVTLQRLGPDGETWLDMGADAALTAAGVVNFEAPPCMVRAEVDGGTPSGLYASVDQF